MKTTQFHIIFCILFLTGFSVFGQTIKQLEEQRKKYKLEITNLNNLLFTEKKKEKSALDELNDIKLKIDVRNKLISTINLEAVLLSRKIKKNQSELNELKKNLAELKADYGDMIFKSYKSKSQQSRIMFLLSSQNFYQAYKRLEYMKQYTSFRKKQGEEILVQTSLVERLNDSLKSQKLEKDILLASERKQKKEIEADKDSQEKLISEIKKKEGKYKKEINQKIKEERIIADRIDKLIKEEIAKANKKITDKPVSNKKDEFILSPAAKALAAKFELNKSKLPWPVKEGLIVRDFGRQPHPTFPGITINSTGLHFATREGNYAEAIFSGEVLNILVGSNGTKNVLIRHGNYISSYNNLDRLYVQKGDNIELGQKIGQIFTDKLNGKTTLVFVLFKNTERLDPSLWLTKR